MTSESRGRGASTGAGWGTRHYYADGSSFLNNFSGGDVVVYDTKELAEKACEEARGFGCYEKVEPEYVQCGSWAPSVYDQLFVDCIRVLEKMPEHRALENRLRERLSSYAPEALRRQRPMPPSSNPEDSNR